MNKTIILFCLASLFSAIGINCNAQVFQYDVIYIKTGMSDLDNKTIAVYSAMVDDLNTGAGSGTQYNFLTATGKSDFDSLVTTRGNLAITLIHAEYDPSTSSYTGDLRSKDDGLISSSTWFYDINAYVLYYCGMVTEYPMTTGEFGQIGYDDVANNIVYRVGGTYTDTYGGSSTFEFDEDDWDFESSQCPEGWHQVSSIYCCPDGYILASDGHSCTYP